MQFQPPQKYEDIPTVDQLVEIADRTIAGLEKAKRRLALLLHRHMVSAFTDVYVPTPNLLMIGPTGGGKTILVTTMLEACGLPWAEGKATEYSPSGFQGRDLPTMYAGLVSPRWAGVKGVDEELWTQRQMIEYAQKYGVLFLDEFDKIRMIPGAPPDKDFGKPLQAELLTMTEGTSVEVVRFQGDRGFTFRTHHVLHIAVGAFQGLDDVMLKIDGIENPTPDDKLSVHLDVDAYDIIKYGFLEELVGRFAVMVPLPKLNHEAMTRILNEHVVPGYRNALGSMGCKFVIEDGAMAWLAGEGTKSKVGARGLPPLFEEVLSEQWAMAKPGDTVAITANSVQQRQAELWPAKLAVAS